MRPLCGKTKWVSAILYPAISHVLPLIDPLPSGSRLPSPLDQTELVATYRVQKSSSEKVPREQSEWQHLQLTGFSLLGFTFWLTHLVLYMNSAFATRAPPSLPVSSV